LIILFTGSIKTTLKTSQGKHGTCHCNVTEPHRMAKRCLNSLFAANFVTNGLNRAANMRYPPLGIFWMTWRKFSVAKIVIGTTEFGTDLRFSWRGRFGHYRRLPVISEMGDSTASPNQNSQWTSTTGREVSSKLCGLRPTSLSVMTDSVSSRTGARAHVCRKR